MAKDGVEGFEQFIAFLKSKYPDSHSEIKQAFVDGNNVILHVEVTGREPALRGLSWISSASTNSTKLLNIGMLPKTSAKTASGNGMF